MKIEQIYKVGVVLKFILLELSELRWFLSANNLASNSRSERS